MEERLERGGAEAFPIRQSHSRNRRFTPHLGVRKNIEMKNASRATKL
jgi:hypothetical protein